MKPDDFREMKVRHLEMIQAVIDRKNRASSQIKGWTVAIGGAAVSYAEATVTPEILLFVAPLVIVQALLDASYLRLERGFVARFDHARGKPFQEEPDFDLSPIIGGRATIWSAMRSWSVAGFYLPILAAMSAAYCMRGAHDVASVAV